MISSYYSFLIIIKPYKVKYQSIKKRYNLYKLALTMILSILGNTLNCKFRNQKTKHQFVISNNTKKRLLTQDKSFLHDLPYFYFKNSFIPEQY